MMKSLKLLSALLIAGMLLTACASTKKPSDESTSLTPSDTTTTTDTVTERDYYAALDKNLKFDGYEFTVLSYDDTGVGAWKLYIAADTQTGDSLNDAAYLRNLEVEELLDVKIKQSINKDYEGAFKKLVLAGDGTSADLIAFWAPGDRSSFISENLVYDWKTVPYVDITADWYNQTANDAYSIAGKQYFAVSDFTYTVQQHFRILFNKDLMSSLNLEFPYQDFYDGKWTFYKMLELCKGVYSDINGDGKADLADRYGLVLNSAFYSVFPVGFGELQVTSDENGFKMNLYSDRIVDIVENVVAMHQNIDVYSNGGGNNSQYQIFRDGNAIFEPYASDPSLLRDIEFDFGYLPYPKFDENQENYVVMSAGGCMAIPSCAENIERTGAIIEALSAASNKFIKDTFVEQYVENKILRDEDSQKIYRMMRDFATYDLSYNIDPSGQLSSYAYYSYFVNKKSADVASHWASIQDKVIAKYAELFDLAKNN